MSRGYSLFSRCLHWGTALLVIVLAGLGLIMIELGSDTPSIVALKITLYSWHKTLGVLALVLGVLRVFRTLRVDRPPSLATHHAMEVAASRVVQTYLLLALIALPLAGLTKHLLSGGPAPIWLWPIDGWIVVDQNKALAEVAGAIHYALAYGLLAAFALHIGGALKHHYLDRDDTLRRMVSGAIREDAAGYEINARPARLGVAGGILMSAVAVGYGLYLSPLLDNTGDTRPANTPPAIDRVSPLRDVVGPPRWAVDYAKSSLEIDAVQSRTPFTARFDRFNAEIFLDPAAPSTGHVDVEIDLASFDSGSTDRDSSARATDWFAVDQFPKARFTSRRITAESPGRFRAKGVLSLKGVEQPLILDFTLKQTGSSAVAEGLATINRSDFKVGAGQWAKDDTISFDIKIRFRIVANR